MSDDTQTAIKVARLEAQVEHLTNTVETMSAKLDTVHEVLLQAKGARWFIITAATIGGAFSAFATKWLPFIGAAPR